MLLKLLGAFCVLATASPLLVSTVAFGSDNYLHIVQDGNTHSGLVVQSGLGNQAGNATLPVHQQGVFDALALTQSGDDNTIGLTGRGLVQDGTGSTDGSAANRATILQQSNVNSIGELVQTTLGTHASTGNFLTVNQLNGGSNTVGSIEQVQGSGASANVADFTQNGLSNWLQLQSQNTTSGEGDNHVTLSITGDYNGIDPGNTDAAGPLAILARSAGASSSEIVQDGDLSGGAANAISLT